MHQYCLVNQSRALDKPQASLSFYYRRLWYLLVCLLLIHLAPHSLAHAQTDRPPATHWAYSTWLGTGIYDINQQDQFVISLPGAFPVFSHGKFTYNVLGSAAIGISNYGIEGIEIKAPSGLGSLVVTTGFQLDYQLTEKFTLKGYLQGGRGFSFSGGRDVSPFSFGFKSLYQTTIKGLPVDFGNLWMIARHVEDQLAADVFSKFDTGVQVLLPFTFTVFKVPLNMKLMAVHTFFTSRFDEVLESPDISWATQMGFNIGDVNQGFWGLRLGFRYIVGDENLQGIRLNLGFPF